MMHWIKSGARIVSLSSFFIAFFLGIDPSDPLNVNAAAIAFVKGCAAALLFWIVGYIVSDVVVKGVLTDVHTNENDIVEGGLLQRLRAMQAELSPESGSGGRGDSKTVKGKKTGQGKAAKL